MRVSFGDEQAPDATTLLKFRHLLEENHLREKLFKNLGERLEVSCFSLLGRVLLLYYDPNPNCGSTRPS